MAKTAVWPNFFLMNVFFALKGSKLFIIICRLLFIKGFASRIDLMVSLPHRMYSFCLIMPFYSWLFELQNVDTKGIIQLLFSLSFTCRCSLMSFSIAFSVSSLLRRIG